ncbi:MAG: hypothetical protein RIS70_1502 [Planctomycetota bacterium]|jgi:predicted nucleic acid-binding protein
MKFLIDTNVLLRLGNTSHALHATARDAVLVLEAESHSGDRAPSPE